MRFFLLQDRECQEKFQYSGDPTQTIWVNIGQSINQVSIIKHLPRNYHIRIISGFTQISASDAGQCANTTDG